MVLYLLLLATLTITVNCQISDYYSSIDQANLANKAINTLKSSTILKDIYYSINILKLLNNNIDCDCNKINTLISDISNSYDIFYGVNINNNCNCGVNFSKNYVEIARNSLMADDVHSIAGGVLATHALDKLTADDKLIAMEKIMNLMSSDGKFRSSPADSNSPTLQNLHYVLEMLSAISIDQSSSPDVAADVFEKAFRLIPGGDNEVETDPLLIVPLSKLTEKKLRLIGTRLIIVAELLMNLKYSNEITILSKVYEAFRIISTYKASPLALDINPNVIDSQSLKLQLKLKDIFGGIVPCESIEIISIKPIGKDTLYFENSKMININDNGDETIFEFDMSNETNSLSLGRYIINLLITTTGRPKPITYQSYFTISNMIEISNIMIGLVDSENELISVNKQNSLDNTIIASALSSDQLNIIYTVSSNTKVKKLHQSFIRLTNQDTGVSIYTLGKRDNGSDEITYSSIITVSDYIEKFEYQSGSYTISILVGDVSVSNPIEFVIGTIELRFPPKQNVILPLYTKSLLHTSDTTLESLPEITHQMRPPAKRASSLMSTIFTVATWVPLMILIGFIISLKPNFSRIKSISSIGAIVCFAGVLLLYISYWLAIDGVSFYDTIRYMFFLLPLLLIFGRYSLMSVASIRVEKDN